MKLAKVSTSHIQAVTGTTFVATLSSLLFGYCTAVICRRGRRHRPQLHRAARHAARRRRMRCSASRSAPRWCGTILGALVARADRGVVRPQAAHDPRGGAVPGVGGGLGVSGNRVSRPSAAWAPDAIWPFIFYRMLGGVAVGLASVIAPMYVGEFAPSAVRGQLGAYQQIAITGGMPSRMFVNWGIALQGDDVWVLEHRLALDDGVAGGAGAGVLLAELHGAREPELAGEDTAASKRRARALARSAEPEEVSAMLEDLATASGVQEKPAPLFAFGARVVLVGVALSVFQQLVGLNAIAYYGPQILAAHGLSHGRRVPRRARRVRR